MTRDARSASSEANRAIGEARNAISTANTAISKAEIATATANIASNKAESASSEANRAIGEARNAISTANNAISKAEIATATANIASNKAESASSEARNAISTATKAQQVSNVAIGLGINNDIKITNTNAEVVTLKNDLSTFEGRARQWNEEQRQLSERFTIQIKQGNAGEGIFKQAVKEVDDKVNKAIKEAEDWNTKLREFKGDLDSFEGRASQWNQQQIAVSNNFLKQLKEGQATNTLIQQGIREVDEKVNKSIADAEAFNNQLTNTNNKVGAIASAIPGIQKRLDQVETKAAAIPGIQSQTRENERLNREGFNKLDQIIPAIAGIPLIPALAANAIRPAIPTLPQIATAAAGGVCQTTRPGGCLGNALNNQANNINNNIGNQLSNGFDKLNNAFSAGANAAQMVLLTRIDLKLGAQITGGISGKLSKISQFLQLGRVLDALTFAATVHNALMLSNDIGQTLLGIIGNVLQLIGIKDDEGNAINVGGVIGSSVENLIKGAIGADNYSELKQTWAKANRIYQSATNVLNTFQNLTSTVLSGLELVAGQTGKIGNALRASGEVLESAYQWMNPQPKINRVTNFLEKLQNGASTIQQVTQVPLDTINAITELQTANTEFIKAIKEDDKPENKGATVEEPAKLAEEKALAKEVSKGLELLGIDLEADED